METLLSLLQYSIMPEFRHEKQGYPCFAFEKMRVGTRINYIHNTVSAVGCQMFFGFSSIRTFLTLKMVSFLVVLQQNRFIRNYFYMFPSQNYKMRDTAGG